MCLEKFVALPALATQHHKAQSIVCFVYRCNRRSLHQVSHQHFSVKSSFTVGLQMPSPSLRCQARRPQSKKVRLAVILPSGLDVEHKIPGFLCIGFYCGFVCKNHSGSEVVGFCILSIFFFESVSATRMINTFMPVGVACLGSHAFNFQAVHNIEPWTNLVSKKTASKLKNILCRSSINFC